MAVEAGSCLGRYDITNWWELAESTRQS